MLALIPTTQSHRPEQSWITTSGSTMVAGPTRALTNRFQISSTLNRCLRPWQLDLRAVIHLYNRHELFKGMGPPLILIIQESPIGREVLRKSLHASVRFQRNRRASTAADPTILSPGLTASVTASPTRSGAVNSSTCSPCSTTSDSRKT